MFLSPVGFLPSFPPLLLTRWQWAMVELGFLKPPTPPPTPMVLEWPTDQKKHSWCDPPQSLEYTHKMYCAEYNNSVFKMELTKKSEKILI